MDHKKAGSILRKAPETLSFQIFSMWVGDAFPLSKQVHVPDGNLSIERMPLYLSQMRLVDFCSKGGLGLYSGYQVQAAPVC
jgi:hypothetical protein